MKRIKVELGSRAYDILIGTGLIKKCGNIIAGLDIGCDAVVVTNKRIAAIYKNALTRTLRSNGITVRFELVPDSETAKSIAVTGALLNRLSLYDVNKQIFIIALGGGVVGDLAGFVAAVYKRGIPYVQIPTTLLAQVDSSIGGKVAIDLPAGKNLVGSFYQPKIVISDISALHSLSLRQIRNGLAEIIKYGIIRDPVLFKFIESNIRNILNRDARALEFIVARSARIKADIVKIDEFDQKGVRACLNYGHTMGHAIEAAGGYSSRYNHGEAVALGMLIAGRVALELERMSLSVAERIERLVLNAGLPTSVRAIRPSKIFAAHLHDKKFTHGTNRFILASNIGSTNIVEHVPEPVIRSALQWYISGHNLKRS